MAISTSSVGAPRAHSRVIHPTRPITRAIVVLVVGSAVGWLTVQALAVPAPDALQIIVITMIATGLVTGLGFGALQLLRRRSIGTQAGVVALTSLAGVAASAWGVAQAMFVSDHDFAVVVVVLVITSIAAMLSAIFLGRRVDHSALRLVDAVSRLDDGESHIDSGSHPNEMARLAAALQTTSERLRVQQERNEALERSRRTTIAWVSDDLRQSLGRIQELDRSDAEALDAELQQVARVTADLLELHGYSNSSA